MPLYEYHCGTCGSFELIRRFSDPSLEACPTCTGPIEKLLSAPAFQFKGTGWYVTDYARKGTNGDGKRESDSKKESNGTKDSDSKGSSETKKESTSPSSSSGTTETKSAGSSDGSSKATTKPASTGA